MRAYEVEKYQETLCTINVKLLNLMKTDDYLKEGKEKDAKINDVIFMFFITCEL